MSEPSGGVPTCYRHPDRECYIRCQRCDRSICPDCMHEASVGFQCPACVAEGRKQTRTGQTPYGGKRSDNPALTSYVLIGLNAAVWLAIIATGWRTSDLINRLALSPVGVCNSAASPDSYYPSVDSAGLCTNGTQGDGVWFPGVADGALWQMITSAFAHVDVWHIGANMLVLWFIGPQLERVLGRTRFLALYLASGLAASVCVFWLSAVNSHTLGASGAIFGMLGALLVVVWKVGGDLQPLLIWLGINAFITFTIPNVSWQGHLGGFLGGALIAALFVFAPRERRGLVQWGGLALLVVVLLAATVARAVTLL
ncbi:rhomboid family intramembrane serine protease [Nocardioides panacisoli]|uniref:rhomboid family intramembrane serine protease n=1 Tax=Nocardioides panacisoli TaxID=627624 RepID=UPI001C626194|nr:rhomboid family intramembrane serine protease [Nocardioides panacisoli]QYJ03236.1 rhomboid family intramembrane serine protease [Nocardioides panacisoli]